MIARCWRRLADYVVCWQWKCWLVFNPSLCLAQLYKEAAFWNLKELQLAIEEEKVRSALRSYLYALLTLSCRNGVFVPCIIDRTQLHLRKDIDTINKDAWWRQSPKYVVVMCRLL
jgi:hypothetical protein